MVQGVNFVKKYALSSWLVDFHVFRAKSDIDSDKTALRRELRKPNTFHWSKIMDQSYSDDKLLNSSTQFTHT
jgi:hypothetical protein